MDDLQTAVHASALASQRSGLWRLLYLGVPLVAILLAGASLGLEALGGASPRVPRVPRPRGPATCETETPSVRVCATCA